MSRSIMAIICTGLLCFTACNSTPDGPATVDAEGVVTLDGNPVAGANVVFVASDGSGNYAQASTDDQGRFSLNAFENRTGAVPGTYNAMVTKNEEVTTATAGEELKGEEAEHAEEGGNNQLGVRNALPEKYRQANPEFQFNIPDGGVTDLKLEMTSN